MNYKNKQDHENDNNSEHKKDNMKKKRLIICSQINIASKNMHRIFTQEFDFKPTKNKFDDEFVWEKDDYQLINIKKSIIPNNLLFHKTSFFNTMNKSFKYHFLIVLKVELQARNQVATYWSRHNSFQTLNTPYVYTGI